MESTRRLIWELLEVAVQSTGMPDNSMYY